MEETRARKTVNNANGCGKRLDEEGDQVSITIDESKSYSASDEWMEEKLRSLEKMKEEIYENKAKENQKPRIQRIPAVLQGHGDTEKYYAPRAISIGPLHHGDPRLEQTEGLKLKLTTLFIMEHYIQQEDLYKKIAFNISDLRSRYVEEDIKSYNNQELTWIFLVDGCSTLHYIDTYVNGDELDDWKIKQDHLLFFIKDIFLLENQLPFELLQLIMDSCPNKNRELLLKSLCTFIYLNALTTRNLPHVAKAYAEDIIFESMSPTHLLDLFRKMLLRGLSGTENDKTRNNTSPVFSEIIEWPNLRSASQLINAGIKIKASKASSIEDIYFTRKMFTGVLYLPTLMMHEATAPHLMNVVAYEMCLDFYNDLQVTSYLTFMNTLIELPNDAKILRNAGVLLNHSGTEEEVAELFKNFRNCGLITNGSVHDNVQYEIQRYYDRTARIATWITQGINDYFSTPWKAMATIAVVLGLVMTFIQTLYAVREKK